MLVLIVDQKIRKYPYSISDLKRDHPNTSFPKSPSDEFLKGFGVHRVVSSETPEVDPKTHSVKEINPKLVDGEWTRNFVVEEHSKETLDALRSEESMKVREIRSQLLSKSDWTQVSDAPVDAAAWRSYRSELRDVTKQEGFPFHVIWPAPPMD